MLLALHVVVIHNKRRDFLFRRFCLFFYNLPTFYGLRRLKFHRVHIILCHFPYLPRPLYVLPLRDSHSSQAFFWSHRRFKRVALRDIMIAASTIRGSACVESSGFARIVRQIVASAGKDVEGRGEGYSTRGKPCDLALLGVLGCIFYVFPIFYGEGIGSYAARGYHGSAGKRKTSVSNIQRKLFPLQRWTDASWVTTRAGRAG